LDLLLVSISVLLIHALEYGRTIKLTLLPTIKEIEPLHHMLHSLKLKDSLEMLLRIKLQETLKTQFSMQRDLLVESLMTRTSRLTSSIGHSRLKLQLTESPSLLSTTWENKRNSNLSRFHQWS